MLFNTFQFLSFAFIFYFVFYLIKNKQAKKIFLLAASYFFYSCWDWRFTFLLLWSTLIDFFISQWIQKSEVPSKRKLLLTVSIVNNLAVLAVFKYYNFFVDSALIALSWFDYSPTFSTLNIILPVGISFYTFQTISYTIDVYRKELKATKSMLDFSLFVSFFPQLVAGPIERAPKLLPQIANLKKVERTDITTGLVLIFNGFFRKVVISDVISTWVDEYFISTSGLNSISGFAGLILFSFQIYFDFSGYSLIARGLAKCLGIDLIKNFNQPYFARGLSDFWKRWHISLSQWLRDYLYIPLGGNKSGRFRTNVNLLITMLLGGLWHGASWNFVIWGALHGFYLIIFRLFGFKSQKYGTHLIPLTYILVLLTWLPFRSPNIEFTWNYFLALFVLPSKILWVDLFRVLYAVVLWVLIDVPSERYKSDLFFLKLKPRLKTIVFTVGVSLILFIMFMHRDVVKPFIYFQF